MSFDELGLAQPLLRAVAAEGYGLPTDIQSLAIPHVIAGRDLLGCAQTGTGKTAAFALPILQRLHQRQARATSKSPLVLVLSPTRELAAQIGHSFGTYGKHLSYRHSVVFGGVGLAPQIRSLASGAHILVATPGRLLDLMNQGYVRLDAVETFVLDEADRMLDMGFLPDLRRIISRLPKKRQTLLFSATMPTAISELATSLLDQPVRVSAAAHSTPVARIEQRLLLVGQANKRALLMELLSDLNFDRILVFTRTKHGADKVSTHLTRQGIVADALHGNKSQSARLKTLDRFKRGRLRVLVATDLASRGIDVDGISHVINFDMPMEPEAYIHRIGRTGRAGADGAAWSMCDTSERAALKAIERLLKQAIPIHREHSFHVEPGRASTPPSTVHRSSNQKTRSRHRRKPAGGQRRRAPAGVS